MDYNLRVHIYIYIYTCRVWDQCNVVQDYLTVYDGGSTSDKVLVRLCGGDAVPDIVSSHNTMLLEFHTSPYDNPFHPVPLSFLPGFELEVQVIRVDNCTNNDDNKIFPHSFLQFLKRYCSWTRNLVASSRRTTIVTFIYPATKVLRASWKIRNIPFPRTQLADITSKGNRTRSFGCLLSSIMLPAPTPPRVSTLLPTATPNFSSGTAIAR